MLKSKMPLGGEDDPCERSWTSGAVAVRLGRRIIDSYISDTDLNVPSSLFPIVKSHGSHGYYRLYTLLNEGFEVKHARHRTGPVS